MFLVTITIILAVFLLEISLSILNYRHRHQPVPANVSDVYEPNAYEKWLRYTMENHRISLMVQVLHTLVLLFFLFGGFFPALAAVAAGLTISPVWQTLLFLGLYGLIHYLLGLGFQWYRVFSIEERYGFNTTTRSTFWLDQLKSLLLSALLGGTVMTVLLTLYLRMGPRFLGYAWLFVMLVILAANVLYIRLFLPLFYKLTPLPEGELRDKIEVLLSSTGFEAKKISVMNASKRTTKLNAFFSGFGRFKHIILFDTLLEKCQENEIVSVLAHEIGHAKNRDVLRNFLISTAQITVTLVLLTFFLSVRSVPAAFGFPEPHLGFAILLFGILMEPAGILAGIPLTALSRRAEYRADAYAAAHTEPLAMISALKVLARENFANLTPHPLVVKMTYSHPTISQRIAAIDAATANPEE